MPFQFPVAPLRVQRRLLPNPEYVFNNALGTLHRVLPATGRCSERRGGQFT
jgi:hypothetical protein